VRNLFIMCDMSRAVIQLRYNVKLQAFCVLLPPRSTGTNRPLGGSQSIQDAVLVVKREIIVLPGTKFQFHNLYILGL
jgi:hypothetical protein